MTFSRAVLAAPLLIAALTLTACSTGAFAGGGASAPAGGGSAAPSAAASAPVAAAGSVSTEGVCGILSISKVNSILGMSYANSAETALPEITIADAAYCTYTRASGTGSFVIQVATSHPADAVGTFNDATGGLLMPQSGIGDSAMYADSVPELVVVWGQTAVAVGQDVGAGGGTKKVTLDQLEKLATAVHAAG